MLVVETIAKIRRAYFAQGKAIKEISRDLGISRKVVRKVIRTGATEFRYEREVQSLPKIGPWRDSLDEMLTANDGKLGRGRESSPPASTGRRCSRSASCNACWAKRPWKTRY